MSTSSLILSELSPAPLKIDRNLPGSPIDEERETLTIAHIAEELGISHSTVYRLLRQGLLRRFKGGIAESSYLALLRTHPERIPYERLPPDQREWLVLNGFPDPSLRVNPPSVRGLLDS